MFTLFTVAVARTSKDLFFADLFDHHLGGYVTLTMHHTHHASNSP
jgi:hypothetical protein